MAEPEEEKQGRGFTVIDRRAGSGEAAAPESAETDAPQEPPARSDELPKIDFATFVLSLFTSALYQMGAAPDPATGEKAPEPNLLLARQTIDTLEMLDAKTRGNLDSEESHLLESALYELRMRFIEISK